MAQSPSQIELLYFPARECNTLLNMLTVKAEFSEP